MCIRDRLMVDIVWVNGKGERDKCYSKHGTFFAEKFVFLETENTLCALYAKGYCKLLEPNLYKQRAISEAKSYKEKLKEISKHVSSLLDQLASIKQNFIESSTKASKSFENAKDRVKVLRQREVGEFAITEIPEEMKAMRPNSSSEACRVCKAKVYFEDEAKDFAEAYFPKVCSQCLIHAFQFLDGTKRVTA
eukprot:TRINITY_DN10434_c0_g1_i2.p1 TRINITY_DN10434_c0_g1~~TRINITY_DN10434_c0_g1_i2.p1  ORF type:complete len:192 (-),score=32.82 TRINITY_DN10434_c0_g1_i2:457-1032(-)